MFRCPPQSDLWRTENRIGHAHNIVFPRVPVGIRQSAGPAVVATPNHVMYYNREQLYDREQIDKRGDACEWFAFDSSTLCEVMRRDEPTVDDHPERPFRYACGPCDARSYLQQRTLFNYVRNTPNPDRILVQETMLGVLDDVISAAYAARRERRAGRGDTQRTHGELVHAACVILAGRFSESLSLEDLADSIGSSPYHLCRIFARQTGLTIHRYLNRLRLRHALERIADPAASLTRVALDLGFSSHSHFSEAFRREFGVSPSHVRRAFRPAAFHQLSKILKAS